MKKIRTKFRKRSKVITDSNYVFTKLHDKASSVSCNQNGELKFGYPYMSQTIFPGQVCRINTGWEMTSIPQGAVFHTYPHKAILDANLISVPQMSSIPGGEIVQQILNNNSFPIKIEVVKGEPPKFYKIHDNLAEEELEIDIGALLSGIASVAAHVVPMFM